MRLFADHPHACGENPLDVFESLQSRGPSPRVWGEPKYSALLVDLVRTIPTRVGRTGTTGSLPTSGADHPHACGENLDALQSHRRYVGPSPRVWGELTANDPAYQANRTIPTRVGRTNPSIKRQSTHSDHPHACGENMGGLG